MTGTFRAALLLAAIALPLLALHRIGADDNAPKNPSPVADTLYDPDPNHLWNRLYAALFIRTTKEGAQYGFDTLDPQLWPLSNHLLDNESHPQAIRVLDEFLDNHGEKLIQDPAKRAMMQHDLWPLFDWYWQGQNERAYNHQEFPEQAKALSTRLAKVIARLALTKDRIASLPDNYGAAVSSKIFSAEFDPVHPDTAFLPPDLWEKDGPWVCVEADNGLSAPIHTREFGGRSAFMMFMKLPGGRKETLAYLDKLNNFPQAWTYDSSVIDKKDYQGKVARPVSRQMPPWPNPDIPQFPAGTEFALVRKMILIDDKGEMAASPLTMSVQLRVYRSLRDRDQSIFEFRLQRKGLFAGTAGGFHEVGSDERDFALFMQPHEDSIHEEIGQTKVMRCMDCHSGIGIHSIASHMQPFSPPTVRAPRFTESNPGRISDFTIGWKKDQFTWGYLKGLWQSEK